MLPSADLPVTAGNRPEPFAAPGPPGAGTSSAAATAPPGAVDWRLCSAIARAHGWTFFLASHCLSPGQRRAIHATYAYCRVADDIADCSADLVAAGQALAAWEFQLEAPTHPVAIAFAAARAQFAVPEAPARELLAGVRMDLQPRHFATWSELRHYCYLVAGTVGLLVAPILGCRDSDALPHAVELGVAMQLTNILRDVGEDAQRGRLYLPADELAGFDCDPAGVLAGQPGGRFRELLAFQTARARELYASARQGLPALPPAGRLTALAASELYAGILTAIEENDYDVFTRRAHVPNKRKIAALPGITATFVRLGWPPAALRWRQ